MMGNFFTSDRPKVSLQRKPPSPQQWDSVQALVGRQLSECTKKLLHERGYRMEYKDDGTLAAVRHITVGEGDRIIIFDSASRDYTHLQVRLHSLNGEAPYAKAPEEQGVKAK